MRTTLPIGFVLLLASAAALQQPEPKYASLASRVLATYAPATLESPAGAGRAALARTVSAALSEDQRERALLAIDDPERRNWTNLPPTRNERGVRLGDLNEEQLRAACDLLAGVLSDSGYREVRDIMLGDDMLLRGGQARTGFGAENFSLVLFGTLVASERWALQLDGHHLALNITLEGESLTMSPSFLGAQPADFEYRGVRKQPLREVQGAAFELVQSLDDEQRARALRSERRGDLVAGPGRDGVKLELDGLACATMSAPQRVALMRLVQSYVSVLPAPQSTQRSAELRSEIDSMVFAWSGPTANPSDVSFQLVGPSLVIDYACQDLGGDPLQHLHSIYRNPQKEYGE